VHQSRHESLQQLPLSEHDLELRSRLAGTIRRAVVRNRARDEAAEEEDAPPCAQTGERCERDERERAYARTRFSSALIAGTTSCRSPITA
jgi:hypothetical protein